MTEDEARTKWCPMARTDAPTGGSHNRDYKDWPVGMCIASDCMMWWWDYNYDGSNYNPKRGYCGLSMEPK